MIQKPYVPILKTSGFLPNPVAGNIPLYADSTTNPKVVGTSAYTQFWDEQIDRCLNGYDTVGIHIPGRYYFFLNFVILKGLQGPQYPFFVDLDLEYHNLFEWVKKNRKMGIVCLKARRKGLSELAQAIFAYGLRFIEGYRGAVAAGLETYTTGLRNKFNSTQNNIIKDLRLNVLADNDKQYKIGFEVRDPIGGYVESGFGGIISFETMYDVWTKLEGEYFNDVIMEESGRFKFCGPAVSSIKPALEFGSQMLGTFILQGTGGNILSTSKDFKDFWDNADAYGLERFWVPGSRMFYPFFGNKKEEFFIDPDSGEKLDSIPNLRCYKPHERIGMEDVRAAEQYILRKRIEYAKLPNKKKLKELNQAYPLTVEEAFTSGGSNNFNDDKIYDTLFRIEGDVNNYRPVILEWVTDSKGKNIAESGFEMIAKARPATKDDPEWKIGYEYQGPMPDYTDLDIGGVDGYNQDITQVSKSLGAMVVLRQGNKVNLVELGIHKGLYPVFLYYKRPPRKEEFFDMCLKIAVYYRLKRNCMINAEQDFVIDYFIKNGGTSYLSVRPKSFDAPKTKQVHKYGSKMTGFSKEMILGIVQTWVENYVDLCKFPELLRDLLAYDEEYIGTDWDSVDALANAVMRVEDMKTRPHRSDDFKERNTEPEWIVNQNGNIVLKQELPDPDIKEEVLKNEDSVGRWTELDYESFKKKEKKDDNKKVYLDDNISM
jgi:hypothetical protein